VFGRIYCQTHHQFGSLRKPTKGTVAAVDLDPTLWRQRIAYLPQRPYLPAQSTSPTQSIVAALVRELSARAAVAIAAHDPEMLAIEGHHIELRHGRIVEERIMDPASGDKPRSHASA
jgi:hypothetical protein